MSLERIAADMETCGIVGEQGSGKGVRYLFGCLGSPCIPCFVFSVPDTFSQAIRVYRDDEKKLRRLTTQEHRDLILKYGYVAGRLETALRRWPQGQAIRRIGMTGAELHLLIGDLSYSCNHGKTGKDLDAVCELCEHLEYAQRTGDGDLDLFW